MTLICPKCLSDMREIEHQQVKVDLCQGCRGLWLDAGELARLRGDSTDLPVVADSLTGGDRWAKVTTYICPRCQGSFESFEFQPGTDLYVERCTSCGGIFLDFGELKKIKQLTAANKRRLALQPLAENQERLRKILRERQGREYLSEAFGDEKAHKSSGGVYLFQLLTGLPVEVENPRQRYPWTTLALIFINVAIFLVQLYQSNIDYLRSWAFIPDDFFAGRNYLGIFTCMFLHGGFFHLAGNMYFLWLFGDNVEDRLSRGHYLLLYLASGLVASLIHGLVTSQPQLPTLGASGAISGIMGAYLLLFPKRKMYQVFFFMQFKVSAAFYLLLWLGLQIMFSAVGAGGVAWFAHIGGFVAGALGILLLQMAGAVHRDLPVDVVERIAKKSDETPHFE